MLTKSPGCKMGAENGKQYVWVKEKQIASRPHAFFPFPKGWVVGGSGDVGSGGGGVTVVGPSGTPAAAATRSMESSSRCRIFKVVCKNTCGKRTYRNYIYTQ